jgi:hypothetical protein
MNKPITAVLSLNDGNDDDKHEEIMKMLEEGMPSIGALEVEMYVDPDEQGIYLRTTLASLFISKEHLDPFVHEIEAARRQLG